MVTTFLKGSAIYTYEVVSNPKDTWHHIKKEAKHYWLGSKLLWSEIKVAYSIVGRLLQGFGMTRRERCLSTTLFAVCSVQNISAV